MEKIFLYPLHLLPGDYKQMIRCMKITTIILFATFLQLSAKSFSQERLSLEYKNVNLEKVFKAIGKKSDYTFLYKNNMIPNKRIDVNATDMSIPEILDQVLAGTTLSYKILSNKLIVITRQNELVADTVVHGRITSPSGEPLTGVSVHVQGSTLGTITDANGRFSLTVPDNATLEVSYVGYKTQTIAVTGQNGFNFNFDMKLEPSSANLNEVVVVGYGTEKKADLTGAVDQVDAKKLESRPIVNLAQGLQGLMPNLNINLGNGEPGKSASFNIRGVTSINSENGGNGSPLILVDGVQMDPNLVSPSDIESVTVLKDAASAAIYGVRAAYGVILITTKNPKKNSGMKLSYSASYTITKPTRQAKYLNSVDYVNMHREADKNGQRSGGSTASMPFTVLDSTNVAKYFNDPKDNLPVYVDPDNPSQYRYVGNTNWIKVLYPGWAPMTDHNLSLSGGQGKTSYIASMDYFYQKGLMKVAHETYKKYNPTIKLNSDVTPWLNLNFKATLNHYESNKPTPPSIGIASGWIASDSRPVMPVYHPDGHFAGQANWTNPVAVAVLNGRTTDQVNDLWFTGGFGLKPVDHLSINGDFNWNFYNENMRAHQKPYDEYGVDGTVLGTFPWTTPSRVSEYDNHNKYSSINLYANYENTFGKHYLKLLVGYNQELKQYNGFSASVKDLIDPNMPAIGLNSDDKPTVTGNQLTWALRGTFFRLNYQYNDKYLLEVNGRYDGTSRFATGKQYVFTPSVSAGWRISQESFFQPLKHVINDLKIRASYGALANQSFDQTVITDPNLYPFIASMPVGTVNYIFGNQLQPYVGAPGLISTDFTWEKVFSKDAGIDFSMFNSRLNTTFDYYIRDTKDMLAAGAPLPAVLGTSAPQKNAADLRTKGWELNLNWQDNIDQDWSYEVGFVLSDYTSRITRYDLNPNEVLSSYYPGYQFGQIWGFVTDGFFQTDEEAAQANQSQLYGGQWIAGDIKFKDLNGDKKIDHGKNSVIDPGDQKIIGNNTPRYQFGLNLSLTYKNFDFTTLLQGVAKRDVMLSGNFFWGFTSEWAIPTVENKDHWTPQNPNAYFPVLRFGGGGNFQTQTKYLQNAAYMRMKNISIGYTLPASLLKRINIQHLRIYVTGQNVFETTKLDKEFDPEVLNNTDYPLNRAYSVGLQLSL